MKWLAFACLVLAVCAAPPDHAKNKKSYRRYQLVQVTPTSKDQVDALKKLEDDGVDFWKAIVVNKDTDFVISPWKFGKVRSALKKAGVKMTIKSSNFGELIEKEAKENEAAKAKSTFTGKVQSVVGRFARHDEVNEWIEEQAKAHSDIASTEDIGTTYENRQMKIIKIGTPGNNKPIIWLDAAIHAREWITVATITYMIERLLDDYTTDPDVRSLVDRFDWYILPVHNPDGYEYSHTNDRLWRKTRGETSSWFCTGSDPNRNWDFHWNEAGTSSNACAQTYPGPSPFSEKCTLNVKNFILNNKANMKLYISIHSYSQLWLTPWGYSSSDVPSDRVELNRVAQIGADALEAVNGRRFQIGAPPDILYAASGGSYDWAKGVAGIKYAYTLELYPDGNASNGFVVSTSDILPSGREIWAAMKATADAIQV